MNRSRGFSLIELVVVIILLGIVAAIAIPRWRGGSGFEERALHDQIVSALRYAQKSAIAARRTVCVTFASARIDFNISAAYGAPNCSGGNVLIGPDGTALSIVPTGSTSFFAAQPMLIFDASGRPGAATSVVLSGLPASLAITVESETGYVH